jgi:hypothetical protein
MQNEKPPTRGGGGGLRFISFLLKRSQPSTRRTALSTQKTSSATPGHTIIDLLIVRAGVHCVIGDDYDGEIALARKFAAIAEGRR